MHLVIDLVEFTRDNVFFHSGIAFHDLPNTSLYPAVATVYGNTEVSLVYLGLPIDG